MKLTATAELLIRLIGREAALRLMAPSAFGGKTFAFPKGELGKGDQAFAALAEVIGRDAALKLCRSFGRDRIYIPRCDGVDLTHRNLEIVEKYNRGATVWELASEYVLSDRQIWTILKNTDSESGSAQSSLFQEEA
ncbi:MAG: Mor transcription activator family protein [Burkholderiaceae bacterium]